MAEVGEVRSATRKSIGGSLGHPTSKESQRTERVGSITGFDTTASPDRGEGASPSTAVETTAPDTSEGYVVQHSRQNVPRAWA